MKLILILAGSATLTLGAMGCENPGASPASAPHADACDASPSAATTAPAHVEIPTTGVHTITLPVMETELPPGPGRLTLLSACTICHTPRYVTMQPNFSKKKWTEEVEKMKKVYGAPLLDEQVEPIVKYLVAIRGNGQ